jgi:O-acetylserine/cysteine efflux transporter
MSFKDICLAILVAFIWGTNYVAMKFTAIEMPGFLSASLRFMLTALILLPFCKRPNISFKNLYFVSITSGAYIGLIYYSMYLGINTCLGIILMQLNAPFSMFIAKFILNEK